MSRLSPLMKQTPLDERPRERCLLHGPSTLSLRECIAVLLGSGPRGRGVVGLAADVLERTGPGLPMDERERAFFTAMESSTGVLEGVPGLGEAGRSRLLVAFELGRRYVAYRGGWQRVRGGPGPQRGEARSRLARTTLLKVDGTHRSAAKEWIGFVPIHRGGEVGALCVVENGVRTHVNLDPADLFARILALRPVAIALVHNHPSGDVTPSSEDLRLTERAAALSRQFGVALIGHWVVSATGEAWICGKSFSE